MNLPVDFLDEMQTILSLASPYDDELFASLYNIWIIVENYFKNTNFL